MDSLGPDYWTDESVRFSWIRGSSFCGNIYAQKRIEVINHRDEEHFIVTKRFMDALEKIVECLL